MPEIGATKTFPNGKTGRWDGQGWEDTSSPSAPAPANAAPAQTAQSSAKPIASSEPDTYWAGVMKGAGEGMAGGLKGFASGMANAPGNMASGIADMATTNPLTTIKNIIASLKGAPGAVMGAASNAGADPEGWGQGVGDVTGQTMIGMALPKVPLLKAPAGRMIAGAGRGLDAAGASPAIRRLAGYGAVGTAMRGDPLTAAGMASTPYMLRGAGNALQGVGDWLAAEKPPVTNVPNPTVQRLTQLVGKDRLAAQPPVEPVGPVAPVASPQGAAPFPPDVVAQLKRQGLNDAAISRLMTQQSPTVPAKAHQMAPVPPSAMQNGPVAPTPSPVVNGQPGPTVAPQAPTGPMRSSYLDQMDPRVRAPQVGPSADDIESQLGRQQVWDTRANATAPDKPVPSGLVEQVLQAQNSPSTPPPTPMGQMMDPGPMRLDGLTRGKPTDPAGRAAWYKLMGGLSSEGEKAMGGKSTWLGSRSPVNPTALTDISAAREVDFAKAVASSQLPPELKMKLLSSVGAAGLAAIGLAPQR